MGDFTKLKVWDESMQLVTEVYQVSNSELLKHDFALINQLRKSAVSVPGNIAEGDEIGSNKQSIWHFYIAKGSVAELITQILICINIGYLDKSQVDQILDRCRKVSIMLHNLIRARK